MDRLFDCMQRAETAPYKGADDFMLTTVYAGLQDAAEQFSIGYDPENPVSCDDALADRLFEGALVFLSRTGFYLEDCNQVLPLERSELLDALDAARERVTVCGQGKDRGILRSRRPDDGAMPWLHLGAGCLASSEQTITDLVAGFARVQGGNSVSVPSLGWVDGLQVVGGSPLEMEACIRSARAARKGLSQAGRPGMPILNLVSSSTTAAGTIAASHPDFGLTPADGWLIDILSEMKVNFESLNRLAFVRNIRGNVGSTAVPILGGYAGGPEGTALTMTASALLGSFLFQGDYHLILPIHFQHGCNSVRQCLWAMAAAGRAISRNMHTPVIGLGFAAAGPCTEMYFHEAAATILAQVPSGYAGIETPHPAKAALLDGITPVEAGFTVDFVHAVQGMSGREANALALRLLETYESDLKNAPQGSPCSRCYDCQAGRPTEEYLRVYENVQQRFREFGVRLTGNGLH